MLSKRLESYKGTRRTRRSQQGSHGVLRDPILCGLSLGPGESSSLPRERHIPPEHGCEPGITPGAGPGELPGQEQEQSCPPPAPGCKDREGKLPKLPGPALLDDLQCLSNDLGPLPSEGRGNTPAALQEGSSSHSAPRNSVFAMQGWQGEDQPLSTAQAQPGGQKHPGGTSTALREPPEKRGSRRTALLWGIWHYKQS